MLKASQKTKMNNAGGKANKGFSFPPRFGNHFPKKAIIAVVSVFAIFILAITQGNSSSTVNFAHAGSVNGFGVGIYWNHACTNRTLSINWGNINAGSNSSKTVYIKNEGNSPATLWLSASKWVPSSSSDYMSLSWNYSGEMLETNQIIPLTLTLTVIPNASELANFSFDIIVTTTSGR